ncbi:MAG: hypothetical protein OEW35_05890 [Gammaproteobacteria bacterium]|nr:hypothetical protein [Gammaproteobacteria bacterium]MDH4254539.1 hypothetical protein [Gammaproteobacteria bacterium]MDH5310389.1 hypothetical protein [Gammaproteobacteria bacterium]
MRGLAAGLLMFFVLLAACVGVARSEERVRTGAYTLEGTPAGLVGAEAAQAIAAVLPPDGSVSWEVFVPDAYDPARPAGLIVYISPSDAGNLPRGWGLLLEERNLIWIAANRSGNRQVVARRIALAVLATGAIANRYELDRDRVYLAGFSGGARVAGLLAPAYPRVFRGALYIGGAEPLEQTDGPRDLVAMQQNRYVFLVGSDDEVNRVIANQVHGAYTAAGMVDSEVIVARRTGHAIPDLKYVSGALDVLDGPATAAAEH